MIYQSMLIFKYTIRTIPFVRVSSTYQLNKIDLCCNIIAAKLDGLAPVYAE